MNLPYQRIFVAGHLGMVGSAVCRNLALTASNVELVTRSRSELDLCDSRAVQRFFRETKPDAVVFAAAKVGGILANSTYPVQFLSENIRMATATIEAAFGSNVQRFLFLGSTCIYPKYAPQPLTEESLLSSPLEPTNEAYALAKIVGLKLCQYYRQQYGVIYHSAMPTNLYGPGDNYHPDHSHVIPGLIRRIHHAKLSNSATVPLWGSGTPKREFLHVDDLAQALVHLLGLSDPPDWVNVGTGREISILDLAHLIAKTIGYTGELVLDTAKPDGTPLKCTDPRRIHSTGWQAKIGLEDGLRRTYDDFLACLEAGKLRSS